MGVLKFVLFVGGAWVFCSALATRPNYAALGTMGLGIMYLAVNL